MVNEYVACYESRWLLSEIDRGIRSVESNITNTEKVEFNIFKRIGKYLAEDSLRIKNKRYIKRLIYEEIKVAKDRFRKEEAVKFSSLDYDDDNQEYEPIDVLANVESGLEIKEAITLLAKGNRKREMILTEWANGSTNDSELSNTLASVFGGQARSHRIFIQRFRIECQSNYYSLAI